MALIVEDGSIVTGANTYVSTADFVTWATAIGEGANLPVDEPSLEALLLNAMFVIEAECYKGTRVSTEQPLSWPRSGVYVDGQTLPSDSIPYDLVQAQCSYALTGNTQTLQPAIPAGGGAQVVEERVEGAITIKYRDAQGNASQTAEDTRANALLRPLICSGSGQLGIIRA